MLANGAWRRAAARPKQAHLVGVQRLQVRDDVGLGKVGVLCRAKVGGAAPLADDGVKSRGRVLRPRGCAGGGAANFFCQHLPCLGAVPIVC